MTDRIAGFIVVLEKDTREDDVAATAAAIEQIKGVLRVKSVIADAALVIARAQARGEVLTLMQKAVSDAWHEGEG